MRSSVSGSSPYRNNLQMMLYAETGELVLEDAPAPQLDGEGPHGDAVVVDVETGRELGRATHGASASFGMFPCPGFGRDFYVATLPGSVARVFVE